MYAFMNRSPASGQAPERAATHMRATLLILLVLTVAGAFAFGRWRAVESGDDPELATLDSFRSSFEQGNALERSYRFHAFLQVMTPEEVDGAAELVDSWNPWLEADELGNFMFAWTAFDPDAALAWGLSRSGSFRDQAAGAALVGWAFHDTEAARRAMEALDPGTAPAGLEEHVVAGWLLSGQHDGVVEYIQSRPRGLVRQRYTNLLTIELMRESPQAVVRWAEGIADNARGSYKRTAFQKAANILASNDPVHASKWIETHLNAEYANGAPGVIGQRWLEVDPPAALEWLTNLPSGDYDNAVRSTLVTWLNVAPGDAEAWVRDASPAAGLDLSVEFMISRSRDDPEAAIDWARRIHDPIAKQQTVVRLGRKWTRRDPDSAKRWLEDSDLSPEMKSAILDPPVGKQADLRGATTPTGVSPAGSPGRDNAPPDPE
jgi:hypothetical protein